MVHSFGRAAQRRRRLGQRREHSEAADAGEFPRDGENGLHHPVAWDPAPASSLDFNYHLSGAYRVTPAILPKTATSHTFTALAPGNDYWLFIYAKDSAGNASGQANLGPVLLPRDTTPPWTAPIVSVDEVRANYANIS